MLVHGGLAGLLEGLDDAVQRGDVTEARIDEATQARWIVEAFNIMAGSGYVAVPMLWNLNYPRDTEMGAFAVLGRPAFDALRQMTGR